ncbi:MAG: hypothetical protein HFF44_02225 [Lawsonibacter sp.]|nr:hypothetical protein [Lawsonibacter sp.]
MGKIKQNLYQVYVTEQTNCAQTMFAAGIQSQGDEVPEASSRMLGVYSGGVSSEAFCGGILGGAAAIGYLLNHGDEQSFETSKQACREFVERCRNRLGTTECSQIKAVWRKEEIRCYDAVEQIAEELESVLKKYCGQ